MLHANFAALCVMEAELLLKLYIAGIGIPNVFLLPWPWPWSDDLHIWKWPVFPGDAPDERKRTSYVNAFDNYHL